MGCVKRALIMVSVAMSLLISDVKPAKVSMLFAATGTPSTSSFVGATFSPNVAPTVRAKRRGANVELTWTAVSLGRVTSNYLVWRVDGSKWTQICLGADVPVMVSATVTCRDRRAAQGGVPKFRYAVEPVHLVSGAVTWSLDPGVPQSVA